MDARASIAIKPVYRSIGLGWWKHVGWRQEAVLPLMRVADGRLATQAPVGELEQVCPCNAPASRPSDRGSK